MDYPPRAYLLKAAGRRRPSVWLETTEPGYYPSRFNGKALIGDWQPPIREIRGLSYALSDALLWSGPGPLVSERAVALFTALGSASVEYPYFAEIKGRPYFAINALQGTDALDVSRSTVSCTDTGRVINIYRHAFKSGIELPPLFKLEERLECDVYCTPEVSAAVVRERLKGFSFWDPTKEHLSDLFLGNDVNCVPDVVA